MQDKNFGIAGVINPEYNLNRNRIVQGLLIGVATTASTQVTGDGASDINVNISAGILLLDGQVKEYAAQADYALYNATPAMDAGESIIISLVAYRSLGDGVLRLRSVVGAAATTGSQVVPTNVEIEALFETGTYWFRLANITVNRTADTTLTLSYDNTVRPLLIFPTIQD